MTTLEFIKGFREEIKIGGEYFFGQLWDGCSGDVEELLESGSVSPDEENIVAFDIVERNDNSMDTIVRVTDIY